jgi:SAM-dependent methyltransferase
VNKGLKVLAMMRLVVDFYHRLRHIATIILGARFNQLEWRYRHIYKRGWAEGYVHSFSHPHRQLLVEKISANAPFTDVLEIGCATGPNLYLLAKKFPMAHFVGVDINPEGIRLGKLFFKRHPQRFVICWES